LYETPPLAVNSTLSPMHIALLVALMVPVGSGLTVTVKGAETLEQFCPLNPVTV
jgi:hypothetical protein